MFASNTVEGTVRGGKNARPWPLADRRVEIAREPVSLRMREPRIAAGHCDHRALSVVRR